MVQRPATALDALYLALGQFRTAWPKRGWTWDSRLSAVASAFTVDLVEEARSAVRGSFPQEWTQRSLGKAPLEVQELVEASGGVRADQLVFSLGPADGLFAVALWWPWGDETSITLRVALAGPGAVRQEYRLRETFHALD